MLDAILRNRSESFLSPLAARLAGWRIRADMLTLSAFLLTAVAATDIRYGHTLIALGFLAAARLLDALDGPVARRAGSTALGPTLDRVLDLVASATIPFAFALADPSRALAAMVLILGLAIRTVAETVSAPTGPTVGKSEFFIAFAIACVFPDRFSLVAYAVGILCFVVLGSRVATVAAKP
jgi:phosphatidylglycerophosphate synthase